MLTRIRAQTNTIMKNTEITYTDHSFSPWWGCTKISEACKHCYAETIATRGGDSLWGLAPRELRSESEWRKPLRWNKAAEKKGERHKVLCASMCDIFEDRPELIE